MKNFNEPRRRPIIQNYLDEFFPDTIAFLISNYDCCLNGELYTIDCFPGRPSGWSWDNSIESWDNIIDNRENNTIHCLCVLQDGKIAIGGNTICKIMNLQTGLCEKTFDKFQGSVSCIKELYDSRIVVCSGSVASFLQILDARGNYYNLHMENKNCYVQQIIVLNDHQIMGDCNDPGGQIVFKIWNTITGAISKQFSSNMSKTLKVDECLTLSTTEMLIKTNRHTLVLWNLQTKKFKLLIKDTNYHTKGIVHSNGKIITYDNKILQIGKKQINEENNPYLMGELPDERIYFINHNRELKIFDMRTNQFDLICDLNNKDYINSTGVLANGQIVCTSQDGMLRIVR